MNICNNALCGISKICKQKSELQLVDNGFLTCVQPMLQGASVGFLGLFGADKICTYKSKKPILWNLKIKGRRWEPLDISRLDWKGLDFVWMKSFE